jgi:hypothetical protein
VGKFEHLFIPLFVCFVSKVAASAPVQPHYAPAAVAKVAHQYAAYPYQQQYAVSILISGENIFSE